MTVYRVGDDTDVVMPGVHMAETLPNLPDVPLPLCWVAEGKAKGATDEEWAISVDHGALPVYYLTPDEPLVSCRSCREWMHA